MASVLNIATRSLSIFQSALATTSNNIVNASTEGYSRQRVTLSARPADRAGAGFIGNGVEIGAIQRVTDEFAQVQGRSATSANESSETFFRQAVDTDALLSNEATNVSNTISEFFSALENLTDDPSYLPSRQTFISQAEIMVGSFNSVYTELVNQSQRIDISIEAEVAEVNTYAQALADLNVKISGNAQISPDLLDQRDETLRKLSELVNVTSIEQTDGTMLVTIGNGQVLVSSANATTLAATRNAFDTSKFDITVGGADITNAVTGGSLGGITSYRNGILDTTINRLGRMAISITDQFNTQHQMGQDLDGNLGAAFFRDVNDATAIANRAAANTNNAGTLDLNVTITNSTTLTDDNYSLSWDGANYTLTNLTDNTSNTFGGLPIAQDGFSINLTAGAPAVGDTFLIRPTAYGANDMAISLIDPQRVAVGQPIRGVQNAGNIGDVELSVGLMSNRATYVATGQPDLPITIRFTATNAYEVRDGGGALLHGGIPYNAAIENDIFPTPAPTNYDPGFRFSMKGDPQVGDTFTIEENTGGVNDSRNAFQLSLIPTQRNIEGNRYTLQEAYGQIISYVGNQANQASVNAKASEILLGQAQDRLASISEVNLEEEAANLLQYQQMFQAASQLINVVSEIFDILNAALS
jgi:flagellar hook-associated protein 1 FlgK